METEKRKMSKAEWKDFVSKNCDNSYSLVICYAIMLLWESPTGDPFDVLKGIGLSGAQAEMAIGFVKKTDLNVTNLQGNPLIDVREDIK